MALYAPYGWGCVFSRNRQNRHCINHSERGWDACIQCSKLTAHPDYDKVIFDLKNWALHTCDMTMKIPIAGIATKDAQEGNE